MQTTQPQIDEDHCYSRATIRTGKMEDLFIDQGTQTDLTADDIEQVILENSSLKATLKDKSKLFKEIFIEKITKSDKSIRKYTGLPNLEVFNEIKNMAVNCCSGMKYWTGNESNEEKQYQNNGTKPGPPRKLSTSDEFILTHVRLRLALPTFVMSHLFGVSPKAVSSIFTTWIFALYFLFKDCIAWPSRARTNKFMPKSFKKSFPRTRAIID